MMWLFTPLLLAQFSVASRYRSQHAHNICSITEVATAHNYKISFALTTKGTCSSFVCNIFPFFRQKMRLSVLEAHQDKLGCDCELSSAVTATGKSRHLFRFVPASEYDCSPYNCWERYAEIRGKLELSADDSVSENRLDSDKHWTSECASENVTVPDVQMESVDEVVVRQPMAGFWSKWKLVQNMVDVEKLPGDLHRRQVVHYKGADVTINSTTSIEYGDAGVVVGPIKGDNKSVVVRFKGEDMLLPFSSIEPVEVQPIWEGFELWEQVYYIGSPINFGSEGTPLQYGQVGHIVGGSERPSHVAVKFSGMRYKTELPSNMISTESPPQNFPFGLSLGDCIYLKRAQLHVPGYGAINRGHKGVIVQGSADPAYVGVMFDGLPTAIELKVFSLQSSPLTEEALFTNVIESEPPRIRESDVGLEYIPRKRRRNDAESHSEGSDKHGEEEEYRRTVKARTELVYTN